MSTSKNERNFRGNISKNPEKSPLRIQPDPPAVRGTGLEVFEGAIRWASSARSAAFGVLGVRASKP